MIPALPAAIRAAVAKWDEDRRHDWEERAAIIEFCGGETREKAERAAYHQMRRPIKERGSQ
jgi:hypothetical protein